MRNETQMVAKSWRSLEAAARATSFGEGTLRFYFSMVVDLARRQVNLEVQQDGNLDITAALDDHQTEAAIVYEILGDDLVDSVLVIHGQFSRAGLLSRGSVVLCCGATGLKGFLGMW